MPLKLRIVLAWMLSLLLMTPALPFAWLHDHAEEEHVHCHEDHSLEDADLCHLTLYHADEGHHEQCEHTAHLTESEDHCSWCQLDLQVHSVYDFVATSSSALNLADQSPCSLYDSGLQSNLKEQQNNRGPPTRPWVV